MNIIRNECWAGYGPEHRCDSNPEPLHFFCDHQVLDFKSIDRTFCTCIWLHKRAQSTRTSWCDYTNSTRAQFFCCRKSRDRHPDRSINMDSSTDDEQFVIVNGIFKVLEMGNFREEWVNKYFADGKKTTNTI